MLRYFFAGFGDDTNAPLIRREKGLPSPGLRNISRSPLNDLSETALAKSIQLIMRP